jgi:Ca2+-binding RTX toxin-like protein
MYDSDQTTATTAFQQANAIVFSENTISQILALATKDNATVRFDKVGPDANGNVTVPSGAEVVEIVTSNTFQTTVKPPVNAPVVIFQGRGGVSTTINDNVTVPPSNQQQVDRVVVGSSGKDNIVIGDAKNTKIILGSGDSTVSTGKGVDTVQAGLGNSTITGNDAADYTVVKLAGNPSNYTVTAQNGHAIITDTTTNKTTDISKIQYVQLDNGNALVFAKNSVEGQVSTLYHTAFGRAADAGGLDYWFDLAKGGATLKQISNAFVNSVEFAATHPSTETNTVFIQSLYQNTFNRAGEDAGVAYWLSQLANGQTKADIIASFATIAIQNVTNTAPNPEEQIVGNVSIVTGIV